MAKQPAKKKPVKVREDMIQVAHRVMLEATGQKPKTPAPKPRKRRAASK